MNIRDLRFIFKPSYWVMVVPYSKEWDLELNQLMNLYTFAPHYYGERVKSPRVVTLGGTSIWVANHPYASFTPYPPYRREEVRPSRDTIMRAMEKLRRELPDMDEDRQEGP